ncbi:DUF3630 family protein [Pseudoalteromonas luteoviolacea]|uniref:DUF3630 domain-containing protein n=1 Tax=Pseudoalteromonas luteoviolacea DSM 6061 TaxID=1365250 RepID=A0A166W1N6_9GAMM|nr:DUF3630 family protein [Pseudoalteromonas luteoviolacea]KZN35172.1 hypothetical protein N475_03485 [Pseudoalteromonas luteoviolacea DSM 6061]KZN52923.1 hypothetical protein N474_03125 [Pseudoalteromonas luteoviolacea CPMOR-2]MBE0384916.1 hypothetical protein [Pseudoalteromonas luteoviolacea DSM 6061]TQF66576.1 DUF3630 family protein [Pseudoalteromonas luteoviolacea]
MTTISHIEDQNILLVTPSLLPESDDFQLWGEVFLAMQDINTIEFNQGADRHQWRFEFHSQAFELNYEYYSESIWISPEGIDATALLPDLHANISSNLQQ